VRQDHLNLDTRTQRVLRHPKGRPRAEPCFAENVEQQLRGAVDDKMLVGKIQTGL